MADAAHPLGSLWDQLCAVGGDVVVPDLAGWRRERMPHVGEDVVAFELAPDWICEVLSPSTGALDRVRKIPFNARSKSSSSKALTGS